MHGVRWVVDGNNVFGARPDGWWNDRPAAMARFTQRLAEWCRTHADEVTVVFDLPVPERVTRLAGGNLHVLAARRPGRDGADDTIAELAGEWCAGDEAPGLTVVTSDRGLRARLPAQAAVLGAGRFRELIGY